MAAGITYLFDPLCGWCYGAGPAIKDIATEIAKFELAPTGLFSGPGAIPMAGFAEMARTHDKRIEALSGQPFNQVYFDQVLGQLDSKVDSHNATLALTAVHLTHSTQELEALALVQSARYRDGLDVTSLPVLITLLKENGHTDAARLLQNAPDDVKTRMDSRVASSKALARRIGSRGVPTLVLQTPRGSTQIESGELFQPRDQLLARLAAA